MTVGCCTLSAVSAVSHPGQLFLDKICVCIGSALYTIITACWVQVSPSQLQLSSRALVRLVVTDGGVW